MAVESWLYTYYRTIISSFSVNNTYDQNLLLLSEINDVDPKLIHEAYDLISDSKITRYKYLSNKTHQSFYTIRNQRMCFTLHGYCSCFKFRENLLHKEKDFSCVHEILCIILDYFDPELDPRIDKIVKNTVYLDDLEFLEKLQTISNF